MKQSTCDAVGVIEEFAEVVVAAVICCNDIFNLNVNRVYMTCNYIVNLVGCSGGGQG